MKALSRCGALRARVAGGALLALAVVPLPARAAPPEIFSQVALHPTDTERMVLAYVQGGQGLLFSSDGGRSFALRCGAAVSSSFTKSRVPLLVTADGETLLGTFSGLVRGGSDGCGFGDDADMMGLQVADFAAHPSDPRIAFLITANATDGRATGLVRRNADGSFTELGAAGDAGAAEGGDISMNRLGVAARPDGRLRVYASALEADDAGNYRAIIRRSDDEGASWVSHEVPGVDGARALLIGVDPTDADRIAVVLSREQVADTLLVSADAGQSFEPRLELFEFGASSVAPDGRLFVGDAGGDAEYSQPGGLYVLADFGASARKLASYPVRCLGYRAVDGALFACQRSEFGRVDPASGAFAAQSSFASVGGFVACGGEALAPVCKAQLCDNWCGVLHYASAPLCDVYDEVNPLCGPAARGYGEPGPAGGAEPPDLVLPGDEPAPIESAVAPRGAPGASAARPESTGCQIGTGAPPPANRALSGLCLALAPWLRRRKRRLRTCDRADESPRSERAHDACNPHGPRSH